jgi:hypothetical protein
LEIKIKPLSQAKKERVVEKSKKAGPKKTSTQQNVSEDAIRLNRYVAIAGIAGGEVVDFVHNRLYFKY